MQTIQIHLLNENEEVIENLIITKRLSNLNETITILLKKHQDLILKNIHEINKIIELQYTIS